MTWRASSSAALLLAWGVCQFLLLTGSPVLNATASQALDLPVGTLVAWLGLVSLPAALLSASPGWLRGLAHPFLWAALLLALPWAILSRALAGNWRFNFSASAAGFAGGPQAAELWWYYSMLTGLLPLAVMLIAGLSRLLRFPGKAN